MQNNANQKPVDRKRRDYWVDIQRILAKLSPDNRKDAELRFQVLWNRGLKPTSVYGYARAVLRADQLLGKPFRDASPADWVGVVSAFRAKYAASSAHHYAVLVKTYLTELLEVEELPFAIRKALTCKNTSTSPGQVVKPEDYQKLLEAAANRPRGSLAGRPYNERAVTLLQTYRYSGFRAQEGLSLQWPGIRFDHVQRLVELALPKDGENLKTGPRTIISAELYQPLLDWKALCPTSGEAKGWVFPKLRRGKQHQAMDYNELSALIRDLQVEAGIQTESGDPYSCHDFRHTCATEKAALGWNEAQMRLYFGWSPDSTMPSLYTHLNLDHMRSRVLQDRGREPTPVPVLVIDAPPAGAAPALAAFPEAVQAPMVLPAFPTLEPVPAAA